MKCGTHKTKVRMAKRRQRNERLIQCFSGVNRFGFSWWKREEPREIKSQSGLWYSVLILFSFLESAKTQWVCMSVWRGRRRCHGYQCVWEAVQTWQGWVYWLKVTGLRAQRNTTMAAPLVLMGDTCNRIRLRTPGGWPHGEMLHPSHPPLKLSRLATSCSCVGMQPDDRNDNIWRGYVNDESKYVSLNWLVN